MDPIYIRTDRNGTKIFHDYTCPRCGGAGEADKWKFTGLTCFACGGTGKRTRPLIVKEYTPEYEAQLDKRRRARAAKYAEDHADEIAAAQAEKERREVEWKARENARILQDLGIGSDCVGYVLIGNTYRIKDQIKTAGGEWNCCVWTCPVKIQAAGVSAVRIDVSGMMNEFGFYYESQIRDLIFCISDKGMSFAEAKEQVADWNE